MKDSCRNVRAVAPQRDSFLIVWCFPLLSPSKLTPPPLRESPPLLAPGPRARGACLYITITVSRSVTEPTRSIHERCATLLVKMPELCLGAMPAQGGFAAIACLHKEECGACVRFQYLGHAAQTRVRLSREFISSALLPSATQPKHTNALASPTMLFGCTDPGCLPPTA